jgi:RNase H-fold protein (predicted Holliday junction resolvase)
MGWDGSDKIALAFGQRTQFILLIPAENIDRESNRQQQAGAPGPAN